MKEDESKVDLQLKKRSQSNPLTDKERQSKSDFVEQDISPPKEIYDEEEKAEEESLSLNFDTDYGGEIDEVNSEEMRILNDAAPGYDKDGQQVKDGMQVGTPKGEDIELSVDRQSEDDNAENVGANRLQDLC